MAWEPAAQKKLRRKSKNFKVSEKNTYKRINVAPSFFKLQKIWNIVQKALALFYKIYLVTNFCKSSRLGVRALGAKKVKKKNSKISRFRDLFFKLALRTTKNKNKKVNKFMCWNKNSLKVESIFWKIENEIHYYCCCSSGLHFYWYFGSVRWS